MLLTRRFRNGKTENGGLTPQIAPIQGVIRKRRVLRRVPTVGAAIASTRVEFVMLHNRASGSAKGAQLDVRLATEVHPTLTRRTDAGPG